MWSRVLTAAQLVVFEELGPVVRLDIVQRLVLADPLDAEIEISQPNRVAVESSRKGENDTDSYFYFKLKTKFTLAYKHRDTYSCSRMQETSVRPDKKTMSRKI